MYAYLGEKVPWLTVHQVLPFVPLAAMQPGAHVFGHGRWWSRGFGRVDLGGDGVVGSRFELPLPGDGPPPTRTAS